MFVVNIQKHFNSKQSNDLEESNIIFSNRLAFAKKWSSYNKKLNRERKNLSNYELYIDGHCVNDALIIEGWGNND